MKSRPAAQHGVIRLVGVVLAETAMLVVLWRAGPVMGSVSLSHLGRWVSVTSPTDALTALIRLFAMAVGVWLLVSTLVYGGAQLAGAESLARRSRWATMPGIRRMVEGLSAASIMASAMGVGGHSALAATATTVYRPVPRPPHDPGRGRVDSTSAAKPTMAGRAAVEVSDRPVGRHLPHPGVLEHVLPVSYAVPDPQAPSPANGFAGLAPGTKVYVVKPGDCLSVIAEDHLGDWRLDSEIHALNVGRTQPDGRALSDDHWIYPGWVLVMPSAAVDVAVVPAHPAPQAPAVPTPAGIPNGRGSSQHIGPFEANLPVPAVPEGRKAQPTSAAVSNSGDGGPPISTEPAVPSGAGQPRNGTARFEQDGKRGPASPVGPAVGVAALVAAGVVWQLGRRRGQQMFLRRSGHQPAKNPQGVVEAEIRARAIADHESQRWIDAGLRHLGAALADRSADDGAVPSVVLVRAGGRGLEVMITPSCPDPPEGWVAVDEGAVWVLDSEIELEDLEKETGRLWSPWPALVTVGITTDGIVLANLEHAGCLHVQGDNEAVTAVLVQMLIELTSQPWSHDMLGGLYTLGHRESPPIDGVEQPDDEMRLAEQLDRFADDMSGAADGYRSLALRRAGECEWLPQVAVGFAGGDPQAVRCIAEAAEADVSGLALVTAVDCAQARWHLLVDTSGQGVLEGRAGDQPFRLPVSVEAKSETLELLAAALAWAATEAVATQQSVPDPSAGVADSDAPADVPIGAGRVEIKIFGPLGVEGGPEPAEPRRQAVALAVLAYLATHPRPVSLGELTGAIWPLQRDDGDTGPTRKTVFNVISRARTQLGRDDQGRDLLVYDGVAYSLSSEVTSDWVRFQRLCTLAARQPEDEARQLYRQALELVGGPPFAALEGSEFYQWVWAESLDSAITATVVDAAETLAALALDADDFGGALWAVEKGLSLDPARERLYQTWMHICGRSGRADRVTDIYKRLCSMLKARIDPTLVPSAQSEGIWKSYLNTDMGEARTAHDRSEPEYPAGRPLERS